VSGPTVSRASTGKDPPSGWAVVGAVRLHALAECRIVGVVYLGTYKAWQPALRCKLGTGVDSGACATGNSRVGGVPWGCGHSTQVFSLCSTFLSTPFLLWGSSGGRRVLEFELCHSGIVGAGNDINRNALLTKSCGGFPRPPHLRAIVGPRLARSGRGTCRGLRSRPRRTTRSNS